MKNRANLGVLASAIIILCVGAGTAGAAVRHVANNGTDSATCGGSSDPCRSITQAIANASAGDRIVVGPGRYGPDVEPGGSCFCMVLVDKAVTLESEEGAGVTVIDASGSHPDVVSIGANNVIFGKNNHGFGIRGGGFGLVLGTGTTGLKANGNLITGQTGDGVLIHCGTGNAFEGNLVIGNGGLGFKMDCDTGTPQDSHVLKNNVVIGNVGVGVAVQGTGHLVTGNVISDNAVQGVVIGGTEHVFTGNAVLGNKGIGIELGADASVITINKNNIYGNDPASNCGLTSDGGSADATKNFWGAAGGPGADPADGVCGGGVVVVTPFATKEFPVSATWK